MNKYNHGYCEQCGSLVKEGFKICWLCKQKGKTASKTVRDISEKHSYPMRAEPVCPPELFKEHLPFIEECRKLLANGEVKSGYEYFQIKVGHIPRVALLKKIWAKSEKEEKPSATMECPF